MLAPEYSKRFGFVDVDYSTQGLTIKGEVGWYAHVAQGSAIPDLA